MAHTAISDVVYDPELFLDYMEEFSPAPTAFIESGVIRMDPQISNRLTEGKLVSVPFFKPLTGNSQVYGNGADLTVNAITSGKQTAIVIGRAQVYGTDDIAAEIASKDPMRSIAQKYAQYWRGEWQRILIATLNGIFAAAGFSTHVHDVAIEDGDNAADENLMGSDVIIDAIADTLGDNGAKIVAMSVHSKVFARMQKLNLITFEPLGAQNLLVPTFLGKRVIVDDAHTVEAGGTSGFKYTSYLFAAGAIGEATGKVKVPVESFRDELTNGGQEALINRQRKVYHLYGSSFTSDSLAGESPTDAELGTGTNWEKVYEDKNIPVIKVVTNG